MNIRNFLTQISRVIESYKESCKNCHLIIKDKKGIHFEKIKTFSEIVEEETIKSIFNIPYIILFPYLILKKLLFYMDLMLIEIYDTFVDYNDLDNYYDKKYIEGEIDGFIIDNIVLIMNGLYLIILILYSIFLIPHTFLKSILNYFNLLLFKTNYFLVSVFKFSRMYERTLVTNDHIDNLIIGNIIRFFIIIFQIIALFYFIFLIPQVFLKYILYFLNMALENLLIYKLDLIKKIYENNNYHIIIVNIYGVFILIFQLFLLVFNVEVILIEFLTFNFNKNSNNIPLSERIRKYSFIMVVLQLIYGFIYLLIRYAICILPSIYYILFDLNLKSKNSVYELCKDLSNIIYNSRYYEFAQIFLGKYCLNIVFYFWNYLAIIYVNNSLSKNTDIIFVNILEEIFTRFYRILFIPMYFPLIYILMYIGIAFKCLSIKIKIRSKIFLELILNLISLIIGFMPSYSMYACFENNSKKIIFVEIPLLIYLIFNLWISGRTLNTIINLF